MFFYFKNYKKLIDQSELVVRVKLIDLISYKGKARSDESFDRGPCFPPDSSILYFSQHDKNCVVNFYDDS